MLSIWLSANLAAAAFSLGMAVAFIIKVGQRLRRTAPAKPAV